MDVKRALHRLRSRVAGEIVARDGFSFAELL